MEFLTIFADDFLKEFWSILGASVVIGSLFLVKFLRDWLYSIFKMFFAKGIKKLTFRESIGVIRYIEDKLVELRTLLNCDRAFINEFKNGDHFSVKNPIWRVSRTYEKCADGVIYQGSTIKAEQVTSMFDIIEPALIGLSKSNGVKIMDCDNCEHPCKSRNTVVYDVAHMPHTASRQLLANHNTKVSMQTGLVINGNMIGLLGLDFCDELSKTMVNDIAWQRENCIMLNRYADQIEYCFANPDKFKKK